MADKSNSGGFESKDAPDYFGKDVPNSVQKYTYENGSEGAARVGNFVPNPFGPSKNSNSDD